jgi:predicted RNase H-like HicB family nuclease
VVIERAEDGGYGVWSPDLPGASRGDTPAEAVEEMRAAIRLHLELLQERGEPVPEPTAVGVDMVATA